MSWNDKINGSFEINKMINGKNKKIKFTNEEIKAFRKWDALQNGENMLLCYLDNIVNDVGRREKIIHFLETLETSNLEELLIDINDIFNESVYDDTGELEQAIISDQLWMMMTKEGVNV